VKENCFETQLRQVHKQSPVQRIVCWVFASGHQYQCKQQGPLPFSTNELDLRAFYNTQKSLLIIWECSVDTCIPSQVTILRIKPHFLYHENQSQELNSKAIFGSGTLNWRGINYFGYGYILCVDQCNQCIFATVVENSPKITRPQGAYDSPQS